MLIGVVMEIQQCGFAHAFIRKIDNKTVATGPVVAHLNLLLSQVYRTLKLG